MKKLLGLLLGISLSVPLLIFDLKVCHAAAQEKEKVADDGRTALTIYNQNFFVAREHVPLDLQPGVNEAQYTGVAAHLEPDSVILRDPNGRALQILEQNYRNDPVSPEMLLSFYEGKAIDFVAGRNADGSDVKIKEKSSAADMHRRVTSMVIRSRRRHNLLSKWTACCTSGCPASPSFPRSAPIPS